MNGMSLPISTRVLQRTRDCKREGLPCGEAFSNRFRQRWAGGCMLQLMMVLCPPMEQAGAPQYPAGATVQYSVLLWPTSEHLVYAVV